MNAVIPLKAFGIAKGRLAPALDRQSRSALVEATADHVVRACVDGGFDITIVTGDEAVAEWAARYSALVVSDPSRGLDAACDAGAAAGEPPWVVVHGDLPLLNITIMGRAHEALERGRPVIAPSRDGGTNLLGASEPTHFSYGPSSFHRHLAALSKRPEIFTDIETLIELDTPADLLAATSLPGGAWLIPFLADN